MIAELPEPLSREKSPFVVSRRNPPRLILADQGSLALTLGTGTIAAGHR